jgi:hypothetical protein
MATALVVSVAGGLIAGVIIRRSLPATGRVWRKDAVGAFLNSLRANLALLVIPLVVMLTNALFVKNCSIPEGIAFFLLLPAVTAWFVSCLAFFCVLHYRHPHVLYFTFMVVTFAYAALLGYFTPAIFSYNFFYGYFPGFTYDELIEITPALVLFRGLTLAAGAVVLSLGILVAVNSRREDRSFSKGKVLVQSLLHPERRWMTAAVGACAVATYAFRCPLGFESTASFVRSELGSVRETDHFLIYYPSDLTQQEVGWIATEHEFRFAQVLRALDVPADRKIESYLYPSAEVKRRYIGAGSTNIAKPWSYQVHLSAETMSSTLKHELVHVLAAPYGIPVLRTSPHPGLTEGLAMAVEWDWGNRTLHQYAGMIRRAGLEPEMERLMSSVGFATQASSLSYILAGSFCRYLIDSRGMPAMTNVYRTGSFEDAYGTPLTELIGEWHRMTDGLPAGVTDPDIVDLYFRRPSIFGKVCARTLARVTREARAKYSDGDYASALHLYQEAYAGGGTSEALLGVITSSVRAGRADVPIALLDTVILRSEFPARFLPSYLFVGDSYWLRNEWQKAAELYVRVATADFSDSYREGATVRLLAMGEEPESVDFFTSVTGDSVRLHWLDSTLAVRPGSGVFSFLRGTVLYRLGAYEEAMRQLAACNLRPVDSFLESRRLRTGGMTLLRLHRMVEARRWFSEALSLAASEDAANDVRDWLERCDWLEETGGRGISASG